MLHLSRLFGFRKRFLFLFILPLCAYGGVVLILSPHITHASGNTYYVATSRSDSNSGTQGPPSRTIQHAANSAGPGDTVYVMARTYNGVPLSLEPNVR